MASINCSCEMDRRKVLSNKVTVADMGTGAMLERSDDHREVIDWACVVCKDSIFTGNPVGYSIDQFDAIVQGAA